MMNRILFGCLAVLFFVDIRTLSTYSFQSASLTAVLIMLIAALSRWSRSFASFFLIGLVLVALPLGETSLSLCAITFALVASSSQGPQRARTLRPASLGFLLVGFGYLGAAVHNFFYGSDTLLLTSYLSEGRVPDWEYILRRGAWSHAVFGVKDASLWLIAAGCLQRVLEHRWTNQERVVAGFFAAYGLSISSLLALLQWHGSAAHWDSRHAVFIVANRTQGLASDPNALGVIAALVIPWFLLTACRLGKPIANLLLAAAAALSAAGAVVSGSRTFFLGLLLAGLFLLFLRKRKLARQQLLLLAASIAVLAATLLHPVANSWLQEQLSYPAATRILRTLNVNTMREMLLSRSLYWDLALSAWQEQPILGIGSHRFFERQGAIARRLGVSLGTYRDNSNSFYLEVLCEAGLVGFLLTILGLWLMVRQLPQQQNMTPDSDKAIPGQVILASCILLLLTGPHTKAPDVLLLFSLLFGISALPTDEPLALPFRKRLLLVGLIVPLLQGLATPRAWFEQGLYPREYTGTDDVAWTAKSAVLYYCKSEATKLTLLPSPATDPQRPVRLVVYDEESPSGRSVTVPIADTVVEVPLAHSARVIDKRKGVPIYRKLEIHPASIWSPATQSHSADTRPLGALIRWPDLGCY